MTARDTYSTTCKTATATRDATLATAETTRQVTMDLANSQVGYNLQTGNYAAFQAAAIAAGKAKLAAVADAERVRQQQIEVARDTLRATGDTAPV